MNIRSSIVTGVFVMLAFIAVPVQANDQMSVSLGLASFKAIIHEDVITTGKSICIDYRLNERASSENSAENHLEFTMVLDDYVPQLFSSQTVQTIAAVNFVRHYRLAEGPFSFLVGTGLYGINMYKKLNNDNEFAYQSASTAADISAGIRYALGDMFFLDLRTFMLIHSALGISTQVPACFSAGCSF